MRDHRAISIISQLLHMPLFAGLQDDEIAKIAQGTREIHARKGDILFHQGAACSGLHFMIDGKAKLLFTSFQGAEKVVEVIREGECLGKSLMFLEKPYVVSAQAISESYLLHISKAVILEEIAHTPEFSLKLLGGMATRLHQLMGDVEAYSLQSGTQRIIGYLLRELPERTSDVETVDVELPVCKGIIASRLNLTQEHFSRILHELSSAGLIDVEGRRIRIVSVAKLRQQQVKPH